MLTIRSILHPTDFSESSKYALEMACALARDYQAKLTLLHVATMPAIYGEGVIPPDPDRYLEGVKQQLLDIKLSDPNISAEYQLVEGDTTHEILRAAKDYKSDLIVMGTHGRSGLSRLLMGSVAEGVVRKATCPVLTVKTPHEK